MQDADRTRFAMALGALATTFGVEADKALIRGYWMGLEDMDIDRVETAMAQALRRCKWMPKPVEIRKLAGEVPVDERVATAWEEVLRLSTNCRAASHPDPVAESAIRKMGGWLSIGTRDADELRVWGRKQFAELYETLAESAEVHTALESGSPTKVEELPKDVQEGVKLVANLVKGLE